MNEPEKKPRRRIKKVKGHGGHHGGAWKVAYADFVTAMMALFLVLWLVSQADNKLKQEIASYFRSPGVFNTLKGGILSGPTKVSKEPSPLTSKDEEQALYSTAELLKKQFETRPEFSGYKDQVKIDVTDEGLRIQIVDGAERVSFSSGSAALTPEARAVLAQVAQGICNLPNPIHIGGHTDRHHFPAGSTYTNWELSAERANAARRELEAVCIKPGQIRRIVGYADTELLLPDEPYATANRRISIIVMRMQADATAPAVAPSSDRSTGAGGDRGAAATADQEQKKLADISAQVLSTEADADHNDAEADEKRLAKKRLKDAGTISIGEPDKVPAGVKRTREAAPQFSSPVVPPPGAGATPSPPARPAKH